MRRSTGSTINTPHPPAAVRLSPRDHSPVRRPTRRSSNGIAGADTRSTDLHQHQLGRTTGAASGQALCSPGNTASALAAASPHILLPGTPMPLAAEAHSDGGSRCLAAVAERMSGTQPNAHQAAAEGSEMRSGQHEQDQQLPAVGGAGGDGTTSGTESESGDEQDAASSGEDDDEEEDEDENDLVDTSRHHSIKGSHHNRSLSGVSLTSGHSAAARSASAAATAANTWRRRRLQLLVVLDHPITTWALIVMSLFVIVQEDFKYSALAPAADIGMESVTLAFLCIFVMEIGECRVGGGLG